MKSENLDPDPWTLAMLALTGIGVVAQLAGTISTVSANRRSITAASAKVHASSLVDQIKAMTRTMEKVVRFVGKLDADGHPVTGIHMRFGSAAVAVPVEDVIKFDSLFAHLSIHVSAMSSFVYGIIQHDSQFAQRIGLAIAESLSDISQRIHAMQSGERTYGEIFDECLLILREFDRILVRLDFEN